MATEMTTITIACYRGRHYGAWPSRLLAWWMRSPYSHCAIVWLIEGDRALVSEATLKHGTVTHWRDWKPWQWDCWYVPADQTAVRSWWAAHEGDPYDWVGLLGFMWRRIKGISTAQWCSEACMASVGVPDPWRWDVAHAAALARWRGTHVPRPQMQID